MIPALLVGPFVFAAQSAQAQDGLWQRDKLTGDGGGTRSALEARGIVVGIAYIGETFTVTHGGIRPGSGYVGRAEGVINTDLERLVGWKGASTHVRAFQFHNAGRLTNDLVGAHADPSNIDALATTRLYTAWFQQNFYPAEFLQ